MNKPLTLPSFLAVLAAIATFGSAIPAWAKNISAEDRAVGRILFFVFTGAFVLFVLWHFWSTRIRNDRRPDVLAAIFPHEDILQLGACHLVLQFIQIDSVLRAIVIAQNRYDAESRLELTLSTRSGHNVLDGSFPTLCINVPPSAVILAQYDVLVAPSLGQRLVTIKACGTCVRIGAGQIVRFAHRTAMQTEIKGWLTMLAAVVGVVALGGERWWEIEILSTVNIESCMSDLNWRVSVLWTPLKPTTIDDLVLILNQSIHEKYRIAYPDVRSGQNATNVDEAIRDGEPPIIPHSRRNTNN